MNHFMLEMFTLLRGLLASGQTERFRLAFRPRGLRFNEGSPRVLLWKTSSEISHSTNLQVGMRVMLAPGVAAAPGPDTPLMLGSGYSDLDGLWTPLISSQCGRLLRGIDPLVQNLCEDSSGFQVAGFVRLVASDVKGIPGVIEDDFCLLAHRSAYALRGGWGFFRESDGSILLFWSGALSPLAWLQGERA
jgi:hypothetical protein